MNVMPLAQFHVFLSLCLAPEPFYNCIACAFFSIRKELKYQHQLIFLALLWKTSGT